MIRFIAILLLVPLTTNLFGQEEVDSVRIITDTIVEENTTSTRLEISIDASGFEGKHLFQLKHKDSVLFDSAFFDFEYFELWDLPSDTVQLLLYDDSIPNNKPVFQKNLFLIENQTSFFTINYSFYLNNEYESTEGEDEVFEDEFEDPESSSITIGELYFSYLENNGLEKPAPFQNYLTIGYKAFGIKELSKHFSFLPGFGYHFGNYSFSLDSNEYKTFNADSLNLKSHYYAYSALDIDFRLRFSLFRESKLTGERKSSFVFDIGARYLLPLSFKEVYKYETPHEMKVGKLHQFKDIRLYANIGWNPITLFVEYRPIDFVMPNYAEIPKWNFGVRVFFQDKFSDISDYE